MLKSTYSALNPLPPGWTEHKAPSGHSYYYNAQTKQSTYKRPAPLPSDSPHEGAPAQPPFGFPAAFTGVPIPAFAHQSHYGPMPFNIAGHFDRSRRDSAGNRRGHDRRPRHPEDRPKSKHAIPGCHPWLLVKTKLGRRFVHNPDTNDSFWKFPPDVLKGVVEYDRLERERTERRERGELSGEEQPEAGVPRSVSQEREQLPSIGRNEPREEEDSDEYEEVEVTDEEGEEGTIPYKRERTDKEARETGSIEFNEGDIEYQLAAMGEEYGLDPGEYGEPGEEGWEDGAEGLPLTEEDSVALFRDLLDDFRINPYMPWEKLIEEGKIIDDSRYTIMPNMRSRREAWTDWSRDRIQELKERREKEEKKDPRIRFLAFLQEYATPKLYWPEFKRKYRKEPEMKDNKLSDKDREKLYRDHVSRLKLSESTRKSDISTLLKSIPIHELNRSSTPDTLPASILADLRYISLPPNVRDSLIQAYILTLSPAPEPDNISAEEQAARDKRRAEREKREKAFAERELLVQEQKRKQRGALMHGRDMLRQGEAELAMAMRVGKEGLKSHMEPKMAAQVLSDDNNG
ncbi:FF domain-containing protein [Histoplasma ohiense]|nr:FF domain-containing protein [Histoplasma ohiense (nom. inval.)]